MKNLIFTSLLLIFVTFSIFTQNDKYGKTTEDSIKCLESHTLYKDPHFINGNYHEAIRYWREAYRICPKSSKNLYINGIKMYKYFHKEATDIEVKNAYCDTIMMIYDNRILYFGDEGKVLGKKGTDLLRLRKDKAAEANEILKKSFEIQKLNMEGNALISLYKSYYELVRQKKMDKKILLETYPAIIAIADYNTENASSPNLKKKWEKAKSMIEQMMLLVATCEDMVEFFKPQFEATPEDTNLLKSIIKSLGKLENQGCTGQSLYYDASTKLCNISPSYDCAMGLGNYIAKKKKFSEAVTYYQKAISLAKTNEEKIEAHMNAAKSKYNIKQFAGVRAHCLSILAIDPNHGEAYILIGDAYTSSAVQCKGVDPNCTQKAVFWAAYDKYQTAKSVNGMVAELANRKMASVSSHFPNKEDCFFQDLYEGNPYTVACWINETTKIRFKKEMEE